MPDDLWAHTAERAAVSSDLEARADAAGAAPAGGSASGVPCEHRIGGEGAARDPGMCQPIGADRLGPSLQDRRYADRGSMSRGDAEGVLLPRRAESLVQ